MDVNKRLEEKRAELIEAFAGLSPGELKIAMPLIEQGAFLSVLCEDLSDAIAADGVTETYSNGATQSGVKISSELKAYCSALSKLTTITARLLKLAERVPRPKKKTAPELMPDPGKISDKAADDEKRQRNADAAFFEALKAGEIKQDQYREFTAAYKAEH